MATDGLGFKTKIVNKVTTNLTLVLIFILLSSVSFGAVKSDPFYLMVTGRVCDFNNVCQSYSGSSGNVQVNLNTDQNGNLSGGLEYKYTVDGVTVTSIAYVSIFKLNGKEKTEVYLEIENSKDSSSRSGTSVLVDDLRDLNSVSSIGTKFSGKNRTFVPELIVGPAK